MNPYAQTIIEALTSSSSTGPTLATDLMPWQFAQEAPTVTPTVDPSLMSVELPPVPFPEPQKANEVPYIKTTRAGVNLSGTELEGLPDATGLDKILTKEQVQNYTNSALYGIKAINALANGFTAKSSYRMQARNAEWQAKQNLRSADLLLKNQREISRAAQADANVYRMQGAKTKSDQKVAMAQTGFAVGKGIYRNTLDTTDARVNYNTSAIILKAELQNAELTRRAGLYESEAIINRANRDIYGKLGRAALVSGILNSASYLAASGAYFYLGKYPAGKNTKGEAVDPMQVKSAKNEF